jgi:hypothetical protein
MGNMSSPSVNRWGLNLFWYRFSFNDKNFYQNFHKDDIADNLIYLFLNYGVLHPKNLFFHKYWFKKSNKIFFNEHSTKYYRVVNFKNKLLNINSFYYTRIKLKNIYFSKIWILKYHSWVIINFYAFQPISQNALLKKKKNYINKEIDFYTSKIHKNYVFFTRFKILYSLLLNKLFSTTKYYNF